MQTRNPYRLARMRAGFTQTDAVRLLNTTQSTLSRIENGHVTPNVETAIKMADLYRVTLDELVGRPGEAA